MKKVFVVDVDNVVVDLSQRWVDWINAHRGNGTYRYEKEEFYGHYDFSEVCSVNKDTVMDFWKQRGLYDNAKPLEGSVSALWRMKHKWGWDIVFASHVEGDHAKSKWEWLNKYFPVDGFVATREKHYIRADAIIDDRPQVLNKVRDRYILKVLMLTPWLGDKEEEFDIEVWEWSDSLVDTIAQICSWGD